MFETTVDNPAPAQESTPKAAPAAAAPATESTPNAELDSGLDLLDETTDPDEVEEELEGVKLKGKKDLLDKIKQERLLHRDYTQKTMSLADERKAFEADREQDKQMRQVHNTFLKEAAQMQAVEDRLQAFQKLDWNAAIAQDQQQAQKWQIEFSQLQARRAELMGSLTQKQQQMQQAQQHEIAKRARDAQAYLQREIKDWSPTKDVELANFAKAKGIDPQRFAMAMLNDPALAVALNDAMELDKFKKQRAAKPKAEPPKPVPRVGGTAASNTKSPSDMTPTEYAKWRQERKSRR